MEKTVINIKVDKKLKKEAQKVAKTMGLPLGTILNNYMRSFVETRHVSFSVPPMPNAHAQKKLVALLDDVRHGKDLEGPFVSTKKMFEALDK